MSMLLQIDITSDIPLFRQVVEGITALVADGTLGPGDRIPSTRQLAARLGVNRSTVYRAYEELWALGYLESAPGSYTVIRKRREISADPEGRGPSVIDWDCAAASGTDGLFETYWERERLIERMGERAGKPSGAGGTIDFATLSPDPRLLPVEEFRKCLNQVLVNEGPELLCYGHPQGYGPLREFIAARMRLHGITVSKEEILITSGAQNGIELVFRALAGPGSGVAFESPSYSRAADILRALSIRFIPIPVTEAGMDLDVLEEEFKENRPSLVYTIPNFHNPTGITTDQPHREQLLHLCEQYRIPLVEDGFEEEMKYFGKAVLPIKSMDRRRVVLYIGTFSKVLFPGLRIGWIAADRECIRRLIPLQKTSVLSGNPLDQAALHRFCVNGSYDLHIRRMHRTYRRRMGTVLKAFGETFTDGKVTWTRPAGGYTLWITLCKPGITEEALMMRMADAGVLVSPGSAYTSGSQDDKEVSFRLSISCLDEDRIVEGIQRIAKVCSAV